MKPGDSPDFFRLPPPPGRSRESTIRLDREGQFWHDGAKVTHPGMARAFASWVARHPDDGRFILSNGYDWSYFQVEESPYFVRAVKNDADTPVLCLFDDSQEPLVPERIWLGAADELYTLVRNGAFVARFQRQAQLDLEPWLVTTEDDRPALSVAGNVYRIESHPPLAPDP